MEPYARHWEPTPKATSSRLGAALVNSLIIAALVAATFEFWIGITA